MIFSKNSVRPKSLNRMVDPQKKDRFNECGKRGYKVLKTYTQIISEQI